MNHQGLRFERFAPACALLLSLGLLGAEEGELAIAPRALPPAQAPGLAAERLNESSGEGMRIGYSSKEQTRRETREVLEGEDLLRRSAAGDEAAERAWRLLPEKTRAWALSRALDAGAENLRRRALQELVRQGTGGQHPESDKTARFALARAAVQEPNEGLRAEACKAWLDQAKAGGKEAVEEMSRGLELQNPLEQKRTFEALKAVGGNDVLEVLITKITRTWGKFPRGHILIGQQRSYIADYDVSGAVYDPVVRSFITGVVLDSQILECQISQYVVEELHRLGASGEVLEQPKEWEDFVRQRRAALGK